MSFEKEIQDLKYRMKNLEEKMAEITGEIKKIRVILEEERKKRIFRGLEGKELELSWPYQKALKYVKEAKENVNARSLAEVLNVSRSRASEILNELYRMGYLEKQRRKRTVIFKYKNLPNKTP